MTRQNIEFIAIGASAGAIEALSRILPRLPANFPIPIAVVVHLASDRDSMIVELFRKKCNLLTEEVEDKCPIRPGVVSFAPPDYHVMIEPDHRFSLSNEDAVHYSRPAVDILFETASVAFGSGVLGIVLTGANRDGAAGLRQIVSAGGRGIVQDPSTAYASAMPSAARQTCPEADVMDLDQIACYLQVMGETT